MKSTIILFLLLSAIITLSFTFITVRSTKKPKASTTHVNNSTEPVGGFVSEGNL